MEPDAENGGSLDVRMQRESALLSHVYGLARKDRAFVHLSSLGAPGAGELGGLLRAAPSAQAARAGAGQGAGVVGGTLYEPKPSLALRGQLMQDDIVAGAHGIEIRYPFLDTAVVQAFLRLPPAAREAAPGAAQSLLRTYMRAQRCPVEPEQAAASKDEL